MTLQRFWWILGGLIVCAAVTICLLPNQDLPQSFSLNDKLSHLLGHALMACYFAGLVARRDWWKILLFQFLLGVGIEVSQSMMHVGREADVFDCIANLVGAGLGLLLARTGLERWPQTAARILGRRASQ
ncbi:MAG: VanZ family protein [Steroidobacteraceae bacterium]|nr:VanZ family protein [Steroidobacteraceae bacterium]